MNTYFLSNEKFDKIIKRIFPNAHAIEKIPSAWTNFVYKVKSDEKIFVFRFPRNDFFSKALDKEIKFNNYISSLVSFNTNKLIPFYDNNRLFSIHELIPGKSLSECYFNLTQIEIESVSKDIANIIIEIENLQFDFTLEPLSIFLTNLSYVNRYDRYDFSKLDMLKTKERVFSSLCHGDLNPGNIIINNGRVVGVLDFAFVSTSAELVDLSRVIGRLPKEFETPLIESYELIKQQEINRDFLQYLISLWSYVEQNYIGYVKRDCKDIILPKFFN